MGIAPELKTGSYYTFMNKTEHTINNSNETYLYYLVYPTSQHFYVFFVLLRTG